MLVQYNMDPNIPTFNMVTRGRRFHERDSLVAARRPHPLKKPPPFVGGVPSVLGASGGDWLAKLIRELDSPTKE